MITKNKYANIQTNPDVYNHSGISMLKKKTWCFCIDLIVEFYWDIPDLNHEVFIIMMDADALAPTWCQDRTSLYTMIIITLMG